MKIVSTEVYSQIPAHPSELNKEYIFKPIFINIIVRTSRRNVYNITQQRQYNMFEIANGETLVIAVLQTQNVGQTVTTKIEMNVVDADGEIIAVKLNNCYYRG